MRCWFVGQLGQAPHYSLAHGQLPLPGADGAHLSSLAGDRPLSGRQAGNWFTASASLANIGYMEEPFLGQEIRRLRLQAGFTLRGLAAQLQISAAHLSDIEHNRRRPSVKLLRSIVQELRAFGATFEALDHLRTGIDSETREWAASTPGVGELLRAVKESGSHPHEILRFLEQRMARTKSGKSRKAK